MKLFLLFFLSFAASLLIAKTVERSLRFRGLSEREIRIYRWLTFTVFFVSLVLLGFFG